MKERTLEVKQYYDETLDKWITVSFEEIDPKKEE